MPTPSPRPRPVPATDKPAADPDCTLADKPFAEIIDADAVPAMPPAAGQPLTAEKEWPTVPGYQILSVLGRGGMGVVYKARQVGLGRYVALKMVLSGAHAAPEDMVRFLAEGEAVAQLQHTNIVQIYQVGRHGEVPFFSLEYVDGGTLAQRLNGVPQLPCESAGLVECLARAMQVAHQGGIVHRDLKPSNILLASGVASALRETNAQDVEMIPLAAYVPKITDFGLAKRVEGGGGLTQTGAILGTPSYMAPEQAEGKKDVGPAADIYALGAILYEMLTGRPPFRAAKPVETILYLLAEEPVPPTRLQPRCPRDLETICLKCLRKEPSQRYATAENLADDLRRFLTDRPILARRTSVLERLRRWRRRNPALAAMMATVAFLLVLLATGSLLAAVWLNRARQAAEDHLGRAEAAERQHIEQLATSYLEQARARRYSRKVGQRFQSLAALTEAVHIVRGMDLDEAQRGQRLAELRNEAIACLALTDLRPVRRLADVFIDTHGTGFQQAVVFTPKWDTYARAEVGGPISLRRLEDDSEIIRLPGSGPTAYILAFSPDGRYLLAKYFCLEKPIEYLVWDWRSGRIVVRQACAPAISPTIDFAFTPDSRNVLLGCRADGSLGRYDLATGKEVARLKTGPSSPWTLALHPDGCRLATVYGKDVTIRNADTGTPLGASWQLPSDVWSLAWQRDGNVLAATSGKQIHLWDAVARREHGVLEGHEAIAVHLAFNATGTLLASYGWDLTTRLWDPVGGKELLQLSGDFLEFSPDGRRLAYVKGQELGIWEVRTGEDFCRQLVQPAAIRHTDFSPDDRLLASAADDDAYLWEVRTGKRLARLGLAGPTIATLFHPSGDLLTVSRWGSSYRWPVRRAAEGDGSLRVGPPALIRIPKAASADRAALDARGHKLAVADFRQKAIVLDLMGASPPVLLGHPRLNFVDISPDGRWASTSTFKGADVKVWDLSSPDPHKAAIHLRTSERATAFFSRDGRWLVVDEPAQLVRYFHRVGSWEVARQERIAPGEVGGLDSTVEGGVMAATFEGGRKVRLFDPATGRTQATLPSLHGRHLHALRFNRDGSRLAAVGTRFVHLWNLRALRAGLAEMGLDWQAAPYPSVPETTAEQPLVVTVKGAPHVDPAPVVILPPVGHRSATAAEIAVWVKQLGDTDAKRRAAAAAALAEVGAPAVKALTAITEEAKSEQRKQARAILDRIAVAEALAPTRVRFTLKDALPADAIRALAEQARLPMTYQQQANAAPPKRISLDVQNISVWEALDRICDAGDLAVYVNNSAVWVSPATPKTRTVRGHAGAFRLEVVGAFYSRSLRARGTPLGNTESLALQVRLLTEPKLTLLSWQTPRLTEAVGADGQSLLPSAPPTISALAVPPEGVMASLRIPLKPLGDRKGKLQILKGVLPVEIACRRQELVTVPDLVKSEGRTFRGEQGHRLTVESVQTLGNRWTLQLRLSGPANWSYEPNTHGLELIDARGRTTRFASPRLPSRLLREPQSEDIAWLAASPSAPSLLALPWPALALYASRPRRMEWHGTVQHFTPAPLQAPVQVRFYRYERLKTEVPFELRDVPLP